MEELLLNSDDFSNGDDSVIYTPGTPIAIDDSLQSAVRLGAGKNAFFTGQGDDSIIAYGPFVAGSESDGTLFGILGASVNMSIPFADIDGPVSDDDTLIGLASAAPGAKWLGNVVGVSINSLVTGLGDDLIVGAALGFDAIEASGYAGQSIDSGSGSDAVIGIAQNTADDGEDLFLTAYGTRVTDVVLGRGADLLVGVGITSGADGIDDGADLETEGVSIFGDLHLGNPFLENGEDTSDNLVIGLGLVQSSGTGGGGPASATAVGIRVNLKMTGDEGSDVLIGVAAVQIPDAEETGISAIGTRLLDADFGGGDDILAGVAFQQGGADVVLDEAIGLMMEGAVETGGGNDLVLGVSWAETESATLLNTKNFYGLGKPTGDAAVPNFLSTGDGEDAVIGIAQWVDPDPRGFGSDGGIAGIRELPIDTGADSDIVIGIGGSGGIYMGFIPVPQDADQAFEPNIDLGSGDDFVFARGGEYGVNNAAIFGDTGNDVFDIQSGNGIIDGGDDIDTLILAGNFEDFIFGDPNAPGEDQISGTLTIISDGAPYESDLTVIDVEFYRFDDQTLSYDQIVETLLL